MRIGFRRVVGACAGISALILTLIAANGSSAAPPPPPSSDPGEALRSRIGAVRSELLAHYKEIDAKTGLADTVEARLDGDEANLFVASRPENLSVDDFWSWNAALVQLDESLVAQLTSGKIHSLGDIRGIDDVPLPAGAGARFQPCAVFVPKGYSPSKPAPLVVLLHAKGESEASSLVRPLILSLAADSGAVVIAPYAHGDDLRSPAGVQDVYSAVDAALNAFSVDRRRVYLTGDSLGGFAAFDVAPARPATWAGILTVRAAMDPSDQQSVRQQLHGKAVYVVAGSMDTIVSVEDVRRSVAWFRSVGIQASYFEAPGAGDDLAALAPSVQRAWREMLAGVRTLEPAPMEIPTMTPPPTQKP